MELNRDEIVKALECCCGDIVECQKCAYVKNGYNRCKERVSQDALALINQLTEENANWEPIAEGYRKQFEDCAEERAKLTEENERLKTELRQTAQKLKAVEEVNEKLTDEKERLQDLVKEVQEYNENWVADNGRLRGILLQFTDIVHKWGNKNGYDTSEISLVSILNEESGIKKQIEADTVREMQHKIWLEFSDCYAEDEICVGSFRASVDEIAKEMLEG